MFQNISRPALLGGVGALAGYMMGKTKKQKGSLAVGYGAVGAVIGTISDKMAEKTTAEAVEAAGFGMMHENPHCPTGMNGYGELEIMDGYGATTTTSTSPADQARRIRRSPSRVRRRFRGRRALPYRPIRPPIAPYRRLGPAPLPPRRVFRARGRVPYRRLPPRIAPYRPLAVRPMPYRPIPYFPRARYPRYPYTGYPGPRGYRGPALTRACMMLLAKIRRMRSRAAAGMPTTKMDGTMLTAVEAPVYLQKLVRAYNFYCGVAGFRV
jgi:hypothetical protein